MGRGGKGKKNKPNPDYIWNVGDEEEKVEEDPRAANPSNESLRLKSKEK